MESGVFSETHTKKQNKRTKNNDVNISYLTLLCFRNGHQLNIWDQLFGPMLSAKMVIKK